MKIKLPKLFHKVSHKTGLAPGSLVYVGNGREEPVKINILDYDGETSEEVEVSDLEECRRYLDKSTMTWINISGIHDVKIIEQAGEIFQIHPLILEDIMNTGQRPKAEELADYFFTVLKMLHLSEDDSSLIMEQISIITGNNLVITFQEMRKDVFEPVRKRIREAPKRMRMLKADYLTYALIDAVVDHYFAALEFMGNKIEDLEEELFTSPSDNMLQKIHEIRRLLLMMRKSIWPLRETINSLTRGESPNFSQETILYMRDLHEHIVQVIETIEGFRDVVIGMVDTYLSNASNRLNEVMKVLTMIATIFIPLSFITGLYGMNFQYMPELGWHYGYFFVLGLVFTAALIMILFFKKKKWL